MIDHGVSGKRLSILSYEDLRQPATEINTRSYLSSARELMVAGACMLELCG